MSSNGEGDQLDDRNRLVSGDKIAGFCHSCLKFRKCFFATVGRGLPTWAFYAFKSDCLMKAAPDSLAVTESGEFVPLEPLSGCRDRFPGTSERIVLGG